MTMMKMSDLCNICYVELQKFKSNNYSIPFCGKETNKINDPLEWWRDFEHMFKVLARLAIQVQFLAIPATSAPTDMSVFGDVLHKC